MNVHRKKEKFLISQPMTLAVCLDWMTAREGEGYDAISVSVSTNPATQVGPHRLLYSAAMQLRGAA